MVVSNQIFEINFVVTDSIHMGFISIFNDKNPLHTDTEFAIQKGFNGIVMHGNILGGFLSFFIGECLPTKNVIIHSQDIKYIKPVYLNDKLLLKAVVNEIYYSVNTIHFKYNFINEMSMEIVAKGNIQIGFFS